MKFDPDRRLGQGEPFGFLLSAEWWNGLLDHVRRGARLVADPATGLQVVPGVGNNTIALAGTLRECWARASTPIGAPSGTNGVQMTAGTVRLWFTDAEGLRTNSGIDVVAYNGWTGETVPANAWIKVHRVGPRWEIGPYDCA